MHFIELKYTCYIWNDKHPYISYLWVFGCKCFTHNNDKTHLTTFDAKSYTCIFIGYSYVSKAYRVYNNRNLAVEKFVHIIFDELSICSNNNNDNDLHSLSNRLHVADLDSTCDESEKNQAATIIEPNSQSKVP